MELLQLALTKTIVKWVPTMLKYRLANLLYPFNNKKLKGIDLVVDYLPRVMDLKFLLNSREHIGWCILFLGEYEKETNQILFEYIKEGMIVVEAGANNGSETVIISKLVGAKGRVYAFEPHPALAKSLSVNIQINNQSNNVDIELLALGDSDEKICFYVADELASNQGMSSKYYFTDSSNTIEVEQMSLDSWVNLKKVSRIDFIKMDIQGAEFDLLKGASTCIKAFRPVIFLEADEIQSNNGKRSLSNVYSILKEYGYDVYLISKDGKMILNEQVLLTGNWLALPHD